MNVLVSKTAECIIVLAFIVIITTNVMEYQEEVSGVI
jgi:hypothetical protein